MASGFDWCLCMNDLLNFLLCPCFLNNDSFFEDLSKEEN
jgi:hypothetical protein